jgi:hypothetical protein
MEHEHSSEAIHERLIAGPSHNYLRDWIYGGIDGSVTTFAVVSGVAGAQLPAWIILILGFANFDCRRLLYGGKQLFGYESRT